MLCRSVTTAICYGLVVLSGTGCDENTSASNVEISFETKEQLGEALFNDTNLSQNRTQACASCHNPEHAFIDSRNQSSQGNGPFSIGDDGVSIGSRNTPTAAYTAFSPDFRSGIRQRVSRHTNHRQYEGPLGGQFWDGRETSLEGQAAGPPLNPKEMGLPSVEAAVARLLENAEYEAAFKLFYGPNVFDDVQTAYQAMTDAIASFERTDIFFPFDSKYDRFLRGEVVLSFRENTGRALFFSEFANCAICHQLHRTGDPINRFEETFTSYEYHNVGIPSRPDTEPDLGFAGHPNNPGPDANGLFKVPTLRNIAVTGPYMHNGIFNELKTVIEFYDKFVNEDRVLNPETNEPWREAEFPDTIAESELGAGRSMTDLQVISMVCFLRTLTDARYEHLIDPKDISCED